LSDLERERLHKLNVFESAKVIFYSGIAWFWSDKNIQKLIDYEIIGLDQIDVKNQVKGNLIIFKHSQHLELDARLLAMNIPIYGVSRNHNSISMNSIQEKGRLSSIQDTADKNNPIKFMRWLKNGKNVLYAIDQDYGWEHSVKLKFFNQDAATITTVKKIIDITNCNLLFINTFYEKNRIILKLESIANMGLNASELSQKINDVMEEKILQYPAEYLWVHRRFKSTLGKEFYQ
jgi:KDO2-lipid IV(A) lauroyltransferase